MAFLKSAVSLTHPVYDVTSQKSDTATRTSQPYQSTLCHIPEEWHCHQHLTALPKYMTSHPRRVTLPPATYGPTKTHDVTSQKSDTPARNSLPYQNTWRHIPEEWHSRHNLTALPKYMTSHPRRVTLPPETNGPTKVGDVWRHIPEEWHSRQKLTALPKYMTSHVLPNRQVFLPDSVQCSLLQVSTLLFHLQAVSKAVLC
jgi:hypothetical protein